MSIKISDKFISQLKELRTKDTFTVRKEARIIINTFIQIHAGVGLSDLPDTSDLSMMIDDFEEVLRSNHDRFTKERYQEIVDSHFQHVDWEEFIKDQIFS